MGEGKGEENKFSMDRRGDIEQMKIHRIEFSPVVLWPERLYWMLQNANVDMAILNIKHRNKTADLVQEYYIHRYRKYSDHVQIFTDGSKNPETEATGAAVMIPSHQMGFNRRTTDYLSVYAVELVAILLALKWAEDMRESKILICSDSVSSLSSIKSGTSKYHHDLVYEILFTYSRITRLGKDVVLMWVPAHSGIPGNEKADKVAKEAVMKEQVERNIKLSKSEGKSIVWREVNKQ